MIQIEVSPEMEARFAAAAKAQGLEAASYAKSLIESAALQAAPSANKRNIEAFLKTMAAYSDKIPPLPEQAFTRESFYRDHD
jgi:hypothetical protein